MGHKRTWPPIPRKRFCVSSNAENVASSDCGVDYLIGHFRPDQVIEPLPGTMARYQIIRIDLLESRNDLPNVVVGQGGHDVKAADNRMYFPDAGSGLRLLDCIDDATVTAGSHYDKTFVNRPGFFGGHFV
jgi:hypothetical protein